jgi:hypothetical protein
MLIPFLFLHTALAEPAVRTDSEGLVGGGNTIEFTVLDVNERFAAVRHVYTRNDEEERPEDCNYPGVDHPTAGVQLALLELQTGKVTTFDVYETAHNGGHADSPKPCTTTAEAKQRLDSAKAAFRKAGLDHARRPKPDIHFITERGSLGKPLIPSVVPVGVDLHDDGSETHHYTLDLYWKAHPLEIRYTETIDSTGTTTVELADDKQVFYRTTRTYDLMQAGTGDIRFDQGFKTPAGMVFLEVFHSFTAMRSSGHTYQYGMTPPIPELSPWVEIAFDLQPNHITLPQPQQITLLVGEPGAAPVRFDLGSMDGICSPFSSTTPISLSVSCGADSHTETSTSIHVKQEGDLLVVDRYPGEKRNKDGKVSADRIKEIPLPTGAYIRTVLGN